MTVGEFLDLMDKLDVTIEGASFRNVADFYATNGKYYTPIYYDGIKENLDNYEYLSCIFYDNVQDPSIYCEKIK